MPKRPVDYDHLPTEQPPEERLALDTLNEDELVALIHERDLRALAAVGAAQAAIARGAAAIAQALAADGRLIYVGAGTSGRLAALDAAECPPTYGISPRRVVAVIAGGRRALTRAVEGAEDSRTEGRGAMQRLSVGRDDVVCGVSASGVTPFVRAALGEGKRCGATTLLVTCAPPTLVRGLADHLICLRVGGELVAGSTRMGAGLATKAVLHSLTTTAMIRLGRVYGNLMVEVNPASRKLERRASRVVAELTGLRLPAAARLLAAAGHSPKVAVVMHHRAVDAASARRLLAEVGGHLRLLIGEAHHGQ